MIRRESLRDWSALPRAGCTNVEGRTLLNEPNLVLAMLRFSPQGTIDEHSAEHDIDVICLEGGGFASVDGQLSELKNGERMRWPAGKAHRLWTETQVMLTLMVEHLGS